MGLVFTTKKNRYYYTLPLLTYWKCLGYFGEAIINPFTCICASIKLVTVVFIYVLYADRKKIFDINIPSACVLRKARQIN